MIKRLRWWKITSLFLSSIACAASAADSSFDDYVHSLTDKLVADGITPKAANGIVAKVKLFRKASTPAPERVKSLEIYIPSEVTEQKALSAVNFFNQYKRQFLKLSEQYEVQPRFILAQWAMMGGFSNSSLATYPLASITASYSYAGQQQAYESEFIAAARLIANGGYSFEELRANTDGTIGPMKFTAEMLLHCAVDGDGNGKIDLWQNPLDIYASAASCLKRSGWDSSQTWGRQVRASKSILLAHAGLQHQASFAEWQARGVRRYDGKNLPKRHDMQVSLIMPDGVKGRKYIVYKNYRALYERFPDHYLVLAIAHLSERIKALGVD